MNKTLFKFFVICLSAVSFNANAQDWRVDIGLGASEVGLDGVTVFDGQLSDESIGMSGEFGVGYRFLDNVYARLSYVSIESLTEVLLIDSYDYSSFRAGIGYESSGESPVVFGAEIGAAFWDIEGTEGFLFNPGSEESGSLDGTDFYVKGSIGYKFNETFTLGGSLDYENNDFGDVTSFRIFGKYSF